MRWTFFLIEAFCGVRAAKPYEFLGFGEMHLVFLFEALCGVSAAEPYEFLWLGEKHLVSD